VEAKACYTTIIHSLCGRFSLGGVEELVDLDVHKMFVASLANRAACDTNPKNFAASGALGLGGLECSFIELIVHCHARVSRTGDRYDSCDPTIMNP
jgi:hypothetical protein